MRTTGRGEERQTQPPSEVTRRLLLTAGACMAAFRQAHGMELKQGKEMKAGPARRAQDGYLKDHEQANVIRRYPHVHEGKGAIDVKFFFRGEQAAEPALFLIYTIPPGASEGVHVHKPGDAGLGSFDEFYYIICGSGEMEIEGERVPVKAGDHVLTPNGVSHGIENTSADGDLKVYLLAMMRG